MKQINWTLQEGNFCTQEGRDMSKVKESIISHNIQLHNSKHYSIFMNQKKILLL